MRANWVADALNRAVLVALAAPALTSLAAPLLVACGGEAGSCVPTGYVPVHGGGGSGQCMLDPYPCGAPLPAGCIGTYDLVQSSTQCDPQDGGAISQSLCEQLCPDWYGGPSGGCNVFDNASGGHVTCNYGPCATGRRPDGLRYEGVEGPDEVARFLSQMAYLEAASVIAFERLARELQAHGAPRRLVTAARRSALDEVRHARVTKRLAERARATVPTCTVEPVLMRSLEEMAVENVVEGCVRETFGAALALFQAKCAKDAEIRRTFGRIARDESRHAQLSWAAARWLSPKLDAEARYRVREAREQAIATLMRDAAHEPDASLTERLGVPSASQARAVLADLNANLWSDPMAA